MTQHAKAPSAGSTQATGSSRGLLRRAFATRGALGRCKGSGAPSSKLLGLLAISLLALLVTAAPALAAPPTVTTPVVSNVSYTTAHVTSEVDPVDGFGTYQFQVSTDGINWTPNTGGFLNKETLNANLTGLDDGTHYFVRLVAADFFISDPPEVISAGPNPQLTTLTADPPTIPGAVEATEVFSTSATGSAEVNRPEASDDVECHFEYVSDTAFAATGFDGATVRPCEPNPIDTEGTASVKAKLGCTNPVLEDPSSCLERETAYRLRVVVKNAAGTVTKEGAGTFTTTAKVAPPSVLAVDDATEVNKRSAQVSGELERPAGADPALDVNCRFEFVTEEQFSSTGFDGAGQASCAQTPIASTAPDFPAVKAEVSAELSGLEPDTTYHYRLAAENGGGLDTEEAGATFTTVAIVPPTLSIDSIDDVGYTSFSATGTADPGNQGVYPWFEFSPAATEEWEGGYIGTLPPIAAESPAEQVFNEFPCFFVNPGTGAPICTPPLKPGTTYKVRLAGSDTEQFGPVHSPEPYPEFTTKGTSTPPSASLDPVTGITGTTAHFSGIVDTHAPDEALNEEGKAAYKTDWRIECTPECKNANGNPIAGTVEAEEGAKAISADTKRLDPNTHYEAKLIATNVLGTIETPIQEFSTPLIKPTVKAAPGGSDGQGGYTLQGIVNPNGSEVSDCKFEWGPNSADYAFTADCSPMPGAGAKAVTVEAHLTGLNPGVVYHYNLLATNAAGTSESGDQEFTPTLNSPEPCPTEQIRKENSSLALPECRAYEMVSPPGKEGFGAALRTFHGGERVRYTSGASNIARSGQNTKGDNSYVAARSPAGWETIPNLNGPSGSLYDETESGSLGITPVALLRAYSSDLRSSLWLFARRNGVGFKFYLRSPGGTFTPVSDELTAFEGFRVRGVSDDLSHLVLSSSGNSDGSPPLPFGTGVYELVGTGDDHPRRVDVDNSGSPVSSCFEKGQASITNAIGRAISADGRVIFLTAIGGCGGANPPTNELWARIDGTTSINVSASQCNRPADDPGGPCNAPVGPGGCATEGGESGSGCRGAQFQAATPDGSRVFFTTKRQLLDADIDETNDLYACDIPSGTPAPVDKANPCSALRRVSAGDPSGAAVESFGTSSENGSTVLFVAQGVLADNEDAFEEQAVAGDHNLYAWRSDAAHPDGQTTFLGRLDSDDIRNGSEVPQVTPDGRFFVFTTASQLLDTDTDTVRDVYRYDADSDELTRASTNVVGVAGNGAGFDARVLSDAVSDDGQKIVFTTAEALSAADGNAEPDVYLWTLDHVSLISTGSVGGGVASENGSPFAAIDGSGQDIYFTTRGALTPADGDDLADVYDARIGGGFSFAQTPFCSGETCQPDPAPAPADEAPSSVQPGPGNPPSPRPCSKGKIRKKNGKCVKKPKKHHGKKASHKRAGGK